MFAYLIIAAVVGFFTLAPFCMLVAGLCECADEWRAGHVVASSANGLFFVALFMAWVAVIAHVATSNI